MENNITPELKGLFEELLQSQRDGTTVTWIIFTKSWTRFLCVGEKVIHVRRRVLGD